MKTETILGNQVLSSWLQWHFESIVLNIIETDNIENTEVYINGKVESLFENLNDEFFANEVLTQAENDGAVIS